MGRTEGGNVKEDMKDFLAGQPPLLTIVCRACKRQWYAVLAVWSDPQRQECPFCHAHDSEPQPYDPRE